MKYLVYLLLTLGAAQGFCQSPDQPAPTTPNVAISATMPKGKTIYVIPIRDEIDPSMVYIVRRGVKEAMEAKADAIILDMDTNGGRVDNTEEIIAILNKFPHQDQLYTFVNTKAFSAGSFISAATRVIYMSPGSVIGAAAPILMSPGGGGIQEMPKTVEEKMTSAVRGLVRTQAQNHGHNPAVFEAMVDKDQGLSIDGKEIVPKGKLLTLTNVEAEARYGKPPKNLLSHGTRADLNAVIGDIDPGHPQVVKIEPTGFEQLARLIVLISPLLIAAAMLCGYIEFKTPGFGVFGILAVVFAVIYFFGHYIAGLSGYENLVIFIIGVALIAVELFLLPGHILPGVIGAGMVLYSLLKAMVDKYPMDPTIPTMPQLELPLRNMGLALVISVIGILLLAKVLPKTPLYGALVLNKVNPNRTPESANDQVVSGSSGLAIGTKGKALTMLRPAGTADFGHGPVDVITQGDFIKPGAVISVVKIEGNVVTVEVA
ncbi:MAG: serine protease [Verrucomicrobiales bacterium]|jgi:membrane-bound serine protease (ClpP class)|nr:serine protease [Verrucomicrobiales bacterium]